MDALVNEIANLNKNGSWKEVKALETTTKILPGTSIFYRKRSTDG
jgi:hypothetical protein